MTLLTLITFQYVWLSVCAFTKTVILRVISLHWTKTWHIFVYLTKLVVFERILTVELFIYRPVKRWFHNCVPLLIRLNYRVKLNGLSIFYLTQCMLLNTVAKQGKLQFFYKEIFSCWIYWCEGSFMMIARYIDLLKLLHFAKKATNNYKLLTRKF